MAVPDTNTFSLQDVVDEISPASDDLSTCIAEATAAYWDTTYSTLPATKLSDFRNYGEKRSCSSKFGAWVGDLDEEFDIDNFNNLSPTIDTLVIKRINVDSFGSTDLSYVKHNGVTLPINQDIDVTIPISDIVNGNLVYTIYAGPNGCASGLESWLFEVKYKIKSGDEAYSYCSLDSIRNCVVT